LRLWEKIEPDSTFPRGHTDRKTFLWKSKIIKLRMSVPMYPWGQVEIQRRATYEGQEKSIQRQYVVLPYHIIHETECLKEHKQNTCFTRT